MTSAVLLSTLLAAARTLSNAACRIFPPAVETERDGDDEKRSSRCVKSPFRFVTDEVP